ncbi:MAG: adenylyltransferase/cytidyltransferase family protein [Candidatus Aenigmarchaeota archaeon]|nr:adenylyltransferase/cytidyltransferase family protein [Candidatus Aenigmarchaeota archaeon]
MGVVLFVGRFQPFHRGHKHAIEKLQKRYEKVNIVISGPKKLDKKNPFSFALRRKMIVSSLKHKNYKIFIVPDVDSDTEWTKTIMKKMNFDVVVTGSSWVKRCFVGIKPVKRPDFLERRKYNATRIRRLMRRGKPWKRLVPRSVASMIKVEDVKR